MGRTVKKSHPGFTLTEMLIVVVMVGMLTLMTLPKFSGLVERNRLNSAREEITAALATARAAAVQKGRTATVRFSGNSMWVTVVTSSAGATTTVVPVKQFMTLYNVSLAVATTDTLINFDMRGFTAPRLPSTAILRIVGTSRRDSVCITPAGQIMPRSCSL
jgi:prepilin-type N-terminal cleavage/methylation domain-containing protein